MYVFDLFTMRKKNRTIYDNVIIETKKIETGDQT